ncbi:Glucose-6-phosphate isomerase [ANME-1 cluster archaeon GoMg1]|nr:Glucose-6-phosphate isomerase [ANME-1 cluster archaeon GoMg1]
MKLSLSIEKTMKPKATWHELKFGERTFYPAVRILEELKEVVLDKNFLATADMDTELYYMFRAVSKDEEDEREIRDKGLRYDLTIIPPNKLGLEFVKTAGHYHPFLPGSKMTYPELYEVLEGEAHYLLQRREQGRDTERITDVVVVKAKKGDKVIIPPNYGHVTINPSEATLKMANWVANAFSSIYEPIKMKGGAAYFELTNGEFVKNANYEEVPGIRFLKPSDVEKELGLNQNLRLNLNKETEMYKLIKQPEILAFLTNPNLLIK